MFVVVRRLGRLLAPLTWCWPTDPSCYSPSARTTMGGGSAWLLTTWPRSAQALWSWRWVSVTDWPLPWIRHSMKITKSNLRNSAILWWNLGYCSCLFFRIGLNLHYITFLMELMDLLHSKISELEGFSRINHAHTLLYISFYSGPLLQL